MVRVQGAFGGGAHRTDIYPRASSWQKYEQRKVQF
jgi:hypothetical protein